MKKYKKIEINQFDFNELFGSHDTVCASCKSIPWSVIDIDIKTKKIRSLLCRKCKDIIVWANDDVEILKRASDYFGAHACS